MVRAECWSDRLNEVGWDLVDSDEIVELHPLEVAVVQYFLESPVYDIMAKDDCNEVEKDLLEIYLKLSGYVKNPRNLQGIKNRLYKVKIRKGDKIGDIILRNSDIPDVWNRIVDACKLANLQIDMNSGTIC